MPEMIDGQGNSTTVLPGTIITASGFSHIVGSGDTFGLQGGSTVQGWGRPEPPPTPDVVRTAISNSPAESAHKPFVSHPFSGCEYNKAEPKRRKIVNYNELEVTNVLPTPRSFPVLPLVAAVLACPFILYAMRDDMVRAASTVLTAVEGPDNFVNRMINGSAPAHLAPRTIQFGQPFVSHSRGQRHTGRVHGSH